MIRRLAFGLLLVLAGCNRSGVADVTLDADAAQRNATAAKTRDDLAAATSASRGPAPVVRDADPVNSSDNSADETRDDAQEGANTQSADNQASPLTNDVGETNSTTP
ncbi:hypothetical protein ACSBM8_18970 [Sphingomonas sp. ASY06-1R]|uniref:hypothetical protein n=1 Tax=Sphingomonas sp. ASY06-1R TaxID=3445771 RepID=UPI003FA24A4B